MNRIPKISVIMAVYNSEKTIHTAIDSILNQTYQNFDFIICDDCSTDQTFKILLDYKEKYPDKIIAIQNKTNSKLAFSLNHCLKYASGEYIARMDGDDISLPNRFEEQIKFLMKYNNFAVVGCNMQRFDGKKKYGLVKVPSRPDKSILKTSVPFCHATIMMKKVVFDELGGYIVSNRTVRGQDKDLWFRFYAKGFEGANLDKALYMVREDKGAVSRRTFKVRWYGVQTSIVGFKLLEFPLIDYHYAISPLFKAFIPNKIMLWYHKLK